MASIKINVYAAYAPAEVESTEIHIHPDRRYDCHFYVPGDPYDRCETLSGAEVVALPAETRHHHTPMPLRERRPDFSVRECVDLTLGALD